METIKKKLIIGVIFSLFATLVNILFKYHSDLLNLVTQNISNIGVNFILFFLIGYVVLGNLLVAKK